MMPVFAILAVSTWEVISLRHGFRSWIGQAADRFIASDPGLGRLRSATSATVAMAAALGVEYLFANATTSDPQARLIAMLIGAVVAMMGSMALTGTGTWRKVRVAVFFPVAIGAGLSAGAAVDRNRDLMLAGFVVVMFLAVFVRRFGLPFFFYGFMLWMGYFFASFLQLTLPMVPSVLVAVAVGSVTVLTLSVTLLRTSARRVLRSTWRAYLARGRGTLRACAVLLDPQESTAEPRDLRRVAARQVGVAEAALMVEGWAEERGALAPAWSGPALRRHAIDVQQTLDRIVAASTALAGSGCDRDLRDAAFDALDHLARAEELAATAALARLEELACEALVRGESGRQGRQLVAAAQEYLELVHRDPEPPETEELDDDFEATAPLMLGNLPGSPAVARDVPARGARWNPLARLDLVTRQAVQASLAGALAIALGLTVSSTRYYWAVIAAFVVFTGTGSRSETFIKAVNRVVGTLLGLFAAIVLAHLTNGHTGWILAVILLSMFLGFYLVRVSYGFMIFFITIMLGQMYTVLHTFSSGLLVLRLEETAVGAAVGIGVALLVTPLSTRDTVRTARDNLLTTLRDLLVAVVGWVGGETPRPDLDGLVRALDNEVRQLNLVAKPLTRPLVWGNDSRRTRHRLRLFSAFAGNARILVAGVRRSQDLDLMQLSDVCRALAEAAERLEKAPPGTPVGALEEPLAVAEAALFRHPPGDSDELVLRPLVHVHRLLHDLADLEPRGDRPAAVRTASAGG